MKRLTNIFLADLPSSIVVFLIALPLCLGIALGSQAPLFSGIISGIIGGLIIGSLSNSQLSVSGPAAGLIAIVVLGIQSLGSFESFLLAVFIAGILQIIFGFIHLGSLGDFIPNTVIKGMLAAIGIILIIKQVPHFVGFDIVAEKDEAVSQIDQHTEFLDLINITDHFTILAIVIGMVSMVILLLAELQYFKKNKIFKFVPAPLIAVIAGALINSYFAATNPEIALSNDHLVFLPSLKSLADIKETLIFPDFKSLNNFSVWTVALTIALVASIETLLCIEATDKIDPYKRRTNGNRELKAQGVGNTIAGLIGGLPITSVIVRSSANINSGAKSKLSAILHSVWLLLAVILIPNLLNKIPYSALSAILILTGYKLAKPSILKDLYRLGIDQLIPSIVTVSAILLTNLLMGILIGIIVSFIFILYGNFKSSMIIVNSENGYLLRFRKDVSFLNKAQVKKMLDKIPANSQVLIDVSKADFIDKDVIEVLNDFKANANLKKIKTDVKKNNFNDLHKLIK